ncbi:hypothetical protein JJC00_18770 [Bradyrhizobium diazoefficiens]|uniref:hypothetical protein n=1 Tax=Bradyrhizobium diazoefficiens TaxID=1355477 RepID=UPI0019091F20|nr:hypothetical protein [Bradyrhizobium diazoefficiens]QQO30729.1 hypothetical protein JJC00_18770 [Bradyrhizobium diazoefficiens]
MSRIINPLRDVWQQDNLINLRKFTNQLLSGTATRNGVLEIWGSSVDRGVDETALPYNSQYNNSIAQWLARLMDARGIPAASNSLFGSGTTTFADLAARDARFSNAPGSLILGSSSLPGGNGFQMSAASGFGLNFPGNTNAADVWWIDNAAGRSFNVNFDAGANTNIPTTGVARYAKTTVTAGAVAVHAINLAWVAGGVVVAGVDAYDNTRKQFLIRNVACAGFTTAACVSENGSPGGGRLTWLDTAKPDAAGGTLGLTNNWRNSLGPAASYADMTTWVQRALANGTTCPFLVTPPYDGGTGTGDTANQDLYVAQMWRVGYENKVPVIPWRESTRSFAIATAGGFLGDNTHLTAYNGAVDAARMIKACLFPD